MKPWLREPLLQFLLLGAAMFAANTWLNRGRGGVEVSRQIALTLDDLRQIDLAFQSQWRRQPTADEFKAMVEDKIQEEILYREGLAMGLDKGDTIVKRRMAQKLQFVAEDVASAHEPTAAELKTWFERNNQKFGLPGRITFRHAYFSPDNRGQRAHDDAVDALKKAAGEPEDSKAAPLRADRFMFQEYYADRSSEQLAKEFGPQFARAIFSVKPGAWQGPLESGYGWHVVFVESMTAGRIPALEEIESDVRTAWLNEQKQQAWRTAYLKMRANYTVLLPKPPEGQTARAGDGQQ
ncbi:MAG TPA: peptidylprolyl isomerase [Vicinamibacterales bacterium]|nr:peptidylprolyl isomerase [Vicinamibacterales bacterium]